MISVGLLETVILTNAGVRIWYDNGSVKETFLRNLSQHGMRRIECDVTVSPKADVKATRTALEQAIEPFQELWKQEGTHASAAEEAKPSDVPQGPRTVREAILQQVSAPSRRSCARPPSSFPLLISQRAVSHAAVRCVIMIDIRLQGGA